MVHLVLVQLEAGSSESSLLGCTFARKLKLELKLHQMVHH